MSPTLLLSELVQDAAPAQSSGTTSTPAANTAPAAAPQQQSPFTSMLMPLLLCAVVFYFLVLGPERKQRKKREAMLKQLGKGDRVMTTGGLYASVVAVADDVVTLQIADGVRARFSRSAIQTVITEDQTTTEKLEAEKAIAKH